MTRRGARAALFEELDALRDAAKSPSVAVIARNTSVSSGTLRSWFPTDSSKPRKVPRHIDQLAEVLEFFLHRAGRLADRATLDRRTREEWERRCREADAESVTGGDAVAMPGWVGVVERVDAEGNLPRARDLNAYQLGATPRRLQQVDPGSNNDEYVPRTANRVDARVTTALSEQQLVAITGPSKAGKTRTLFEALIQALPDARVLVPQPRTLHEIPHHQAFQSCPDVIVIWLENLQDFLTADSPLTPALLTHLMARSARTVVAA